MDTHQDDVVLANAVDILMSKWALNFNAARAALVDITNETGVELEDLAALVVAAAHGRQQRSRASQPSNAADST